MTTEQNHNDPRVSEAYSDLATERTPPELDRKVLSMAAAGTRSRYGLARAWVRPVAWAATIGLSLAFVLEMSQLRNVATPQVDADTVYQLEEVVIRDEAPAKAKDELRRLQIPVKRTDAPQAKPMSSPPAAAEPVATPGPSLESPAVSAEIETDDMSLLRETEEQARTRSGSERPESVVAGAAAFAEKKEDVEHCDEDARMTVDTWYACVLELRNSELAEAADQEFEALLMEFPDFLEPAVNR
jgi:hypothetical protein